MQELIELKNIMDSYIGREVTVKTFDSKSNILNSYTGKIKKNNIILEKMCITYFEDTSFCINSLLVKEILDKQ
ncbi:MAG TPA: hypothetical protein PKI46_08095 [Bacteroidales bacterium]|nr:hypothetical protein [Bacteroidales bacterium]